MEFIIELAESLYSMFNQYWEAITDFYSVFYRAGRYLGAAASIGYHYVSSLPPWLTTFGSVTIIVSLIFTILGRSTGGNKVD